MSAVKRSRAETGAPVCTNVGNDVDYWRTRAMSLESENATLRNALQNIFHTCSPYANTTAGSGLNFASVGPVATRTNTFDQLFNSENISYTSNAQQTNPATWAKTQPEFAPIPPVEQQFDQNYPAPTIEQPLQAQPVQPVHDQRSEKEITIEKIQQAVQELHKTHMKDRTMPYIKVKKFLQSAYGVDVNSNSEYADALRDALSAY
mmetsp:Transcript_20730/g.41049  ORF Transcript_20730/g.41049 Transcript_20730/m.41049 type:complete len:205 (+) Transcript_20730:33-647(+)|eukprot:CAMPEP_0175143644 /NCGR_PEP_ID=MMETSP0087-20121206/13583_1 /TAXON_ID=136419 /ORGANISM="Unknown Unknown, Strain D1" /LENGTH=204 /DNA_ID=CAMNT_0016427809 /DNA_START=33 /DNA_END=647 /DNA_ORIENTATION=+